MKEKTLEEKYITTLINLQMTLEGMFDLKDTAVYKRASRKRINTLEEELVVQLRKEGFEKMYLDNEETFSEYIKHVEYISKWVTRSSFADVLELGAALERGSIRFVGS